MFPRLHLEIESWQRRDLWLKFRVLAGNIIIADDFVENVADEVSIFQILREEDEVVDPGGEMEIKRRELLLGSAELYGVLYRLYYVL